jgi:hypothetical protein
MKISDFQHELHELAYTGEVNQRYHQIKQRQMWWWDKAVKIGVAVLAVVALVTAFLGDELKLLEQAAASVAAVAAIVLNVIPVGEWETHYGELFRAWSDLLLGAEKLELKARELDAEAPVHNYLLEQFADLRGQACQLDATEHAPDDKLLDRCQGDINERAYGSGIRTYEQAMAVHAKAKQAIRAGLEMRGPASGGWDVPQQQQEKEPNHG